MALKPSEELIAASFGIATVVSVFGNYTAPVNDIKAAAPDHQTHNDTKRAALVSTALVAGVAAIARSPMIFVIGGAAIVLEVVVRAHANYTMPTQSA
jgi:hypothetical protein